MLGILLAVFLMTAVYAADREKNHPEATFYNGNTFYEEGRYDEAIQKYSILLEQGYESGNLYFNIGNCYFKKGKLGKAIVNYERARRLIPRDNDLKENVKFAHSKIKYRAADSSSWKKRIWKKFDLFTINEITLILAGIYTAAILYLIVNLFFQKARRYRVIILAVSMVVFVLFSISLYYKASVIGSEAVIISEKAGVRFEPIHSATIYFTLYEGMKLYVIETKTNWAKIRRQDGKTGWIEQKDMEVI
ncbi:MAG: tetratricopeptide repeat protein [Desulfobacterales bacterium]